MWIGVGSERAVSLSSGRGRKSVTLEIVLHEDEHWAEWDMWRNDGDTAERISAGTSFSLESAIDHALKHWTERNTESRDE